MAEWEEKLGAILNDPQAMAQIMSIAQSLGGGPGNGGETPPPTQSDTAQVTEPPAPEPETPSLDPRLMAMGMRVLGAYQGQDNQRAALLQALRPYVKPERYAKVDKAVQIAKLAKAIRVGLDGVLGGGEDV